LLFSIDGYSNDLPEDSVGKNPFKKSKSAKIVLLKQSIVNTALDEFEWWRSGTTLRESDEKAVQKVKQYWLSVGRQTKEKQLKDSLWQEQHPWSAVFISWVMSRAGVGEKLKNSPSHAGYIVWARQNIQSKNEVYTAYDVCDPISTWPEPGDLICKNRGGNNFSLAIIKAFDISHSDIVVEVDTIARTITTVGGNLCNT
jgi:hypothetical protein